MNIVSRTITGALVIILGLFLITINFPDFWMLIEGGFVFVIGLFILFNKKEDDIEEIKGRKNKN